MMETSVHTFSELFEQLGLESSSHAINHFLLHHSLASSTKLSQAAFWSTSQAHFLDEALEKDSDWSELVEQLDNLLRH